MIIRAFLHWLLYQWSFNLHDMKVLWTGKHGWPYPCTDWEEGSFYPRSYQFVQTHTLFWSWIWSCTNYLQYINFSYALCSCYSKSNTTTTEAFVPKFGSLHDSFLLFCSIKVHLLHQLNYFKAFLIVSFQVLVDLPVVLPLHQLSKSRFSLSSQWSD